MGHENGCFVLIYIDASCDTALKASARLADTASRLAHKSGKTAAGVVCVERYGEHEEVLRRLPLSKIYVYYCPGEHNTGGMKEASAMYDRIIDSRASVVLVPSTDAGRILAARIAVWLETGIAADCTQLSLGDNMVFEQKRRIFGGGTETWIHAEGCVPQIATVKTGMQDETRTSAGKPAELVMCVMASGGTDSQIKLLRSQLWDNRLGIENAEAVIVVGGGISDRAQVKCLCALAESIGAKLACTKAVVQKGWMPCEYQVGVSGKSISPRILLTLGVSGSEEFLAGIRGAEYVTSVNTDPKAPIFSVSDLPIVGDIEEIIPLLMQKQQIGSFAGA